MPKKRKSSEGIKTNIEGDISGQMAVGNQVTQIGDVSGGQVNIGENIHQTVTHTTGPTQQELEQLHQLLKDLRARVEAEVESDKKDSAIERIDELEKAVMDKKPDLSTMEYVKNWFGRNLPSLAGAVTSVVVHPIVGKLVEAGGDLLVKEFTRRFGNSISYP